MVREEMIREKAKELSRMADNRMVRIASDYFKHNRAMPGEKSLKDTAAKLLPMFEENPYYQMEESFRERFVSDLAFICIKEVELHKVQALSNAKNNKNKTGLRAHDLPMKLSDDGRYYEMPAEIFSAGKVYITINTESDYHLATLPEQFIKNFKDTTGMKSTVIARDHSNGNFACMSYRLVIDLAQKG